MEGVFSFLIIVAIAAINIAARSGKKQQRGTSAKRLSKPSAPIGQVSAQRRAQMRSDPQWREAKRQQDDAEQLHSIHMDSCESRLESLRVLHEAGILDNEEYAQRVARVKAQHAVSGRR